MKILGASKHICDPSLGKSFSDFPSQRYVHFPLIGGAGVEREAVDSLARANFVMESKEWRKVREKGGLSDTLCPRSLGKGGV